MYGRNRKDGEKEQCTGKPFAHHTTSIIFVGQADFDFFVRLRTQRAIYIYARRHAGASQLRLLARNRALIGAYFLSLLLVARVNCAVLYYSCAVLCLRCLRDGGGSKYLIW